MAHSRTPLSSVTKTDNFASKPLLCSTSKSPSRQKNWRLSWPMPGCNRWETAMIGNERRFDRLPSCYAPPLSHICKKHQTVGCPGGEAGA